MQADASLVIEGLPPGPIRIVAEERWSGGKTAERMATAQAYLEAGEARTLDLEIHEPALAKVRVLKRPQGELIPVDNVTIEVRAIDNPLDRVAGYELDPEGRAEVPLETVRQTDRNSKWGVDALRTVAWRPIFRHPLPQ
ncbi:hypothetical protein Poly30_49570 [Planctomycetes bacterium Poly30]|uniref:Uncharacterized protein n=1 Tax=Saltatorellus ferox TaxID=2528018 RepID=A0A518EZ94_9BACT|nr:hypothetical protein Poly30_49570 [Planctomycetes bacterium Poly30]